MTSDYAKSLRLEAIAFAADILEDFKETSGAPSIAVWLEDLADEFDTARREDRGMDPYKVRSAVQALINVAKFPPNNSPEKHSSDQGFGRFAFETPLFFYESAQGRPEDIDGAGRTTFTVTAVAARFDLNIYQNDEPSPNTNRSQVMSAIWVVAEAYKWLAKNNKYMKFGQKTYSGVRDSYERGLKLSNIKVDGAAHGMREKELAIKMAMIEEK
jgi:hypothetical protein